MGWRLGLFALARLLSPSGFMTTTGSPLGATLVAHIRSKWGVDVLAPSPLGSDPFVPVFVGVGEVRGPVVSGCRGCSEGGGVQGWSRLRACVRGTGWARQCVLPSWLVCVCVNVHAPWAPLPSPTRTPSPEVAPWWRTPSWCMPLPGGMSAVGSLRWST